MMRIVGSITVERGVSPWRWLTEFDKAVSAERLQGHSLAGLQEPRLCMWMHIRASDERQRRDRREETAPSNNV